MIIATGKTESMKSHCRIKISHRMIVAIFLVESHLREKISKAGAYDICIATEWSDQGNLINFNFNWTC